VGQRRFIGSRIGRFVVTLVVAGSAPGWLLPVTGTHGMHSARAVARPGQIFNGCSWTITVPYRAASQRAVRQASQSREYTSAKSPYLKVSSRAVHIGARLTVHGFRFNPSHGPVSLNLSLMVSDMIFEVQGGHHVTVQSDGSFVSRIYIPYGIPTTSGWLTAGQAGGPNASISERVLPAVDRRPSLSPVTITQVHTYNPAGRERKTFKPGVPIRVVIRWQTHYIDFLTSVHFGVQVVLHRHQWRFFGPVERGGYLVRKEKEFCYTLIPPKGTYDQLQMVVDLTFGDEGDSAGVITERQVITVHIARPVG
jgi:hypothetical protein